MTIYVFYATAYFYLNLTLKSSQASTGWRAMEISHDLFRFFKTLGLVVNFKTLQNFPYFGVFFDHKKFNRHKLWCSTECVSFALFNYSSLSYIDLALSYAETKLTKKTLIFHDFQGLHDFPGFPWPVQTLPCNDYKMLIPKDMRFHRVR